MLGILSDQARDFQDSLDRAWYDEGHAAGLLVKTAGEATNVYALSGRLVLSTSGWLLLDVPNALVRGLFAALDLPGVELPPGKPTFNAHISVARPEELDKIPGGGGEAVTERGKRFRWQLGPVREVEPAGWQEMSKVYFASVTSPELQLLRKSYGLTPLPQKNGEDMPFHLTLAVRRRNVLRNNDVSKRTGSKAANVVTGPGPGREAGGVAGAYAEIHDRILRVRDDHGPDRDGQGVGDAGDRRLKLAARIAGNLTPKIAGVVDDLKDAKRESDRKNYPRKHQILRRLIRDNPDDFREDSSLGGIVGITHAPSGFKIHATRSAVPALRKAAGVE